MGFSTTKTNWSTWEKHEWMNSSHVFSLGPIRSNRLLSHCHTSKTPLGRSFKTYSITGFFRTATESQPRNRQKLFLQLFVLKLALFTVKRFLMSFVLALPGLAFIFHPTIALPVYFSSVCVIPLRFFLPLLLHPVFTFAVGSNRGA